MGVRAAVSAFTNSDNITVPFIEKALLILHCKMEQLPTETLVHILGFLDVPSRLQLARGNQALRRKIYRDCAQAWVEFKPCTHEFDERFTDLDLSRLLTRVNAREVTKSLDLQSCNRISGSGLMPLRNSRVLERVDLRGTAAEQNPTPFLSILNCSIPYKLVDVTLNPYSVGFKNKFAIDFMRQLRQVKLLQAQENMTVCSCCEQVVVQDSRNIVPNFYGVPLMHCLECKQDYCRRASCDMDVRECQTCAQTFCKECNIVFQCHYCGKSYCDDVCVLMDICIKCHKICCDHCAEIRCCSHCQKKQLCRDWKRVGHTKV